MLVGLRWAFPVVAMLVLGGSAGHGQGVEYQKVEAEGVGADYDAALNAALSHAVAQVNGVDVARRVLGESAHGTASETSSTKAAAAVVSVTEHAAVTAAAATAVVPADKPAAAPAGSGDAAAPAADDETKSAGVVAAEHGIAATRTLAVGAATSETRHEFNADKTIVAMASSTAGVVNRYQLLSSEQLQDGWHIRVLAEIAKYQAAGQDQRRKVAVLPLRLDKADARYRDFEGVFRTDLVNQLTQSGKVALLDRDFSAEQEGELAFLKEDGVKKEEMAKLGNKLGADYVIVGVVADASVKTDSAYIQSVGRTVTGASTASAKISYRVVETATGRIELADNWETAGRSGGKVEDIAAQAAQEIARSILEALFPMRVEHVSNGVFYLGQGGKSVQIGQQYRVVRLGDDIVDSYTKEVIGRDEEEIGLVTIFEVEPKLAKARLTGAPLQPVPADTATLVVRLVKSEAAAKPEPAGSKPLPGKAPPTGAKALLDKKQGDW